MSTIKFSRPVPSDGSATTPGPGTPARLRPASPPADQNLDPQRDALTTAGCYRVFADTDSGAVSVRPSLDKLLDQLRPGDTLVVWKLDRLGRSLAASQLSSMRRGSLGARITTGNPRRLGLRGRFPGS